MSLKKLQIINNIITTDATLTQSGYAADAKIVGDLINIKKDVPQKVYNINNPLLLVDNTEYYLTNISDLTIHYPDSNFDVWMRISFSTTEVINVIFPEGTKYIGSYPTFNNGETWEISIKDGVAICWRVE